MNLRIFCWFCPGVDTVGMLSELQAQCRIISADQKGAKTKDTRNDCVTPNGKSHVSRKILQIMLGS
jgi:hypothetical protein